MTVTNSLGTLSVSSIADAREAHGTSVAASMLVHDLRSALEQLGERGLDVGQTREILNACRAVDALGYEHGGDASAVGYLPPTLTVDEWAEHDEAVLGLRTMSDAIEYAREHDLAPVSVWGRAIALRQGRAS